MPAAGVSVNHFSKAAVALHDKSQPPRLCAKPSNFDYESFKAVKKAGFL